MPKVTGTRKQKARELFERLKRGPAIFPRIASSTPNSMTKEEFEHHYRIWFSSYISAQVRELIPELRNADKQS